jgi:hypothetical protein
MTAGRAGQLAIGDILAAEWADNAAALGQFCERAGLSVSTAKQWQATAAAVTPDLRKHLEDSGVFVSYSVLREGARPRGGQVPDPGYAKLLHLIDDAKNAGVDRVNLATYQTVLGTAPPLAAVMDPQARDSDDHVIDYVTEVQHSPNRDELVKVLAVQEQVTRAEVAAAFEARRAQKAQHQSQTQSTQPQAGTGAALAAALAALAGQAGRLAKRFPGLVTLDTAQQADIAVALGDLDVFMAWARQVSAVRPVARAGTGRRQHKTVTT